MLKAGGRLYIKDGFRLSGPLSLQAVQDLTMFDQIYAHRTPTLDETSLMVAQVGFGQIQTTDLSTIASKTYWGKGFTISEDGKKQLSAFGKLHAYGYQALPVFPGEVRAIKPISPDSTMHR